MERTVKSVIFGAAGTLLVLCSAVLAPLPAQAGADGRKNTTIALGAAAAWELLHHKTLDGIALGAGAVYAEKKYEDARRSERDAKNRPYYYQGDVSYGSRSNNNYRYSPNSNSNYDNNNNNDRYGNGNYNSGDSQSQDSGAYYYKRGGSNKNQSGRFLPPGQRKKQQRECN